MVLYIGKRRHRGPQLLTHETIVGDERRSNNGPAPPAQVFSLVECTRTAVKPKLVARKKEEKPTTEELNDKEPTAAVSEAESTSETRNYNDTLVRSGKGRRTRHVRFGHVFLQEHAVTVGDHPECKGNFPLTLDWGHAPPAVMEMKDYESRRTKKLQLHMDVRERYERLRLVTGLTDSKLVSLEQRRLRLQLKSLQPTARRVL